MAQSAATTAWTKRPLRHCLEDTQTFVTIAELATSRGLITDLSGSRILELARVFHSAEHVLKMLSFDCHDCGDCSLPEIAYLCPESQCAKNQRNGPCGGTELGLWEVGDKECIWARAYDRLKAYGEEERMLEGPVVFKNGSLKGTSAWANAFLGRDHRGNSPSSS